VALSEVERLRGVVLSQQSDQRFDSDIALAKALLGNDLRLDQLRDVRMSGPLRKQSDYIKQWNARFFVLVGRFLLYYAEKKEDALPNGAMLLTNVTVTADDNIKKVRCSPGCLEGCGMGILRTRIVFAFRLGIMPGARLPRQEQEDRVHSGRPDGGGAPRVDLRHRGREPVVEFVDF